MTNPEDLNHLSADKPLSNPDHDQLGYSPFAENLSKSIYKMAPLEGFVIAIYGQWGSGKSTVLNFLEYYLKQMPENELPVVMRFNPWWFSGHEDLTMRFFDQLQAALSNDEWKKNLSDSIATFADIVSKIPEPATKITASLIKWRLHHKQNPIF